MILFEKIVEEKIREAMASGEFNNLPGKGKPLDLSGYFATPEHLRISYTVLKNAGFIPEEVELLKEIESLRVKLERCCSEDDRARVKKAINDKLLKFNMIMECYKQGRRT
jgi:hypothetical protein